MSKSDLLITAVLTAALALTTLESDDAEAKTHRSASTVRQFKKLHPCPSTHRTYGPCPGYVADHRVSLCEGGPDVPGNLRWQEYKVSKQKDKWECKPGWAIKLDECEQQGCFVND